MNANKQRILEKQKLIGERIGIALESRKRSQAWLADKVGLVQSTISKAIIGGRRLYQDQFEDIAVALDMGLDELRGWNAKADEMPTKEEMLMIKVSRKLGITPEEAIVRLQTYSDRTEIEVLPEPSRRPSERHKSTGTR